MVRNVFITDCEGPLTLNDNAYEIAAEYIEDGDKLFKIKTRLSCWRYIKVDSSILQACRIGQQGFDKVLSRAYLSGGRFQGDALPCK